ncbi:MAG: hypothetical protein KF734_19955 [Saprospiraceae bacterium]|nr:hypothetical protein [Saprospiraceae bacterium]
MKATFICLANSYKEGGRCVAGIECHNGIPLWNEHDKPRWIRPVSADTPHGEIDSRLSYKLKLLDVVEMDVFDPVPEGHQVENVLFNPNSLKTKGVFPDQKLETLCDQYQPFLFGNASNSVSVEEASELSESLTLIKVVDFRFAIKPNFANPDKPHVRLHFDFNKNQYNLPVTDPIFLREIQFDQNFLNNAPRLYLCLSLGILHEGLHYKLVAGIIPATHS